MVKGGRKEGGKDIIYRCFPWRLVKVCESSFSFLFSTAKKRPVSQSVSPSVVLRGYRQTDRLTERIPQERLAQLRRRRRKRGRKRRERERSRERKGVSDDFRHIET